MVVHDLGELYIIIGIIIGLNSEHGNRVYSVL